MEYLHGEPVKGKDVNAEYAFVQQVGLQDILAKSAKRVLDNVDLICTT